MVYNDYMENDDDSDVGIYPVDNAGASYKSKAYSKLSRELSEEDLSNPSISKMLLSQIDTLETENILLKKIEENFHIIDKENGILKEKQKRNVASDILSQFCLTLAEGLLSISTLDFSNPVKINNSIFIIFGVTMLAGVLFSYWKR